MACAAIDAAHGDDGFEDSVVIGAGRGDLVARWGEGAFGSELLQAGLVVLAARPLGANRDVVDHQIKNDFGGPLPACIDEHRTEDGFQCVGENGLFVASSRLVLTAAKKHLCPDPDATGDDSERGGVDHRCSELCELPLGEIVVGGIDVFGDCEAEHGIAKELEPLVRLGCIRLCTVAAVCQRQLQKCGISELVPDGSSQFLGVGRFVQESAPTWLNT